MQNRKNHNYGLKIEPGILVCSVKIFTILYLLLHKKASVKTSFGNSTSNFCTIVCIRSVFHKIYFPSLITSIGASIKMLFFHYRKFERSNYLPRHLCGHDQQTSNRR